MQKKAKKEDKKKDNKGKGNRPHVRLNSVFDIQKFLARLINKRYRSEIGSQRARDLTYMLKHLLETFEKGQFEERLKRLEDEIKGNAKP